jgi:cobalt-zinc-cadmium resistance protein CzcA
MFLEQQVLFSNSLWSSEKSLRNGYEKKKASYEIQKSNLSLEISKYIIILFIYKTKKLYFYLDSLYQNFFKASNRRFELGETNYLEKKQAKFRQIKTSLSQIKSDKSAHYDLLYSLIQKTIQ